MGILGPGPVPLWSMVRDGCVRLNCHGRHFHGVFQEGQSGSPLAGEGVGVGGRSLLKLAKALYPLIGFPWAP